MASSPRILASMSCLPTACSRQDVRGHGPGLWGQIQYIEAAVRGIRRFGDQVHALQPPDHGHGRGLSHARPPGEFPQADAVLLPEHPQGHHLLGRQPQGRERPVVIGDHPAGRPVG